MHITPKLISTITLSRDEAILLVWERLNEAKGDLRVSISRWYTSEDSIMTGVSAALEKYSIIVARVHSDDELVQELLVAACNRMHAQEQVIRYIARKDVSLDELLKSMKEKIENDHTNTRWTEDEKTIKRARL